MNPRFLVLPAALVACHSAQALVYLSVEQAQALMCPGQTLVPLVVVLSASDIAAIEKDSGVQVFAGSLTAWKSDTGYFFTDSVIGKHDLIRYAVALDPDGKVRGVEILDHAKAGTTHFFVYRSPATGENSVIVALTAKRGHEFSVKILDESVGPADDRCPRRILDHKAVNAWCERRGSRIEQEIPAACLLHRFSGQPSQLVHGRRAHSDDELASPRQSL